MSRKHYGSKPAGGNKPPADRVRYFTSKQLLAAAEPSWFGPPKISVKLARKLSGYRWLQASFFRYRGGWSSTGMNGARECARRRRQKLWLNETAPHQRA